MKKRFDSDEPMVQDVSQPMIEGAIHGIALGDECDYRMLARVKVAVDKYFNDVQNGKKNPKASLKCLREELTPILDMY